MTSKKPLFLDEGGLSGDYSPIQKKFVHDILKKYYGISGTIKRFETEKDDTFRVTPDNGTVFILKIANPKETFKELDFQNSLLKHIEQRDCNLAIPRVLNTLDGREIFQISDIHGSNRYVRALSFISGTPLSDIKTNSNQRIQIGKVLARLRIATEGFSHESENRLYAWDVQNLKMLENLLTEIEDQKKRTALSKGLDRFSSIYPKLRECRKQVLHNDFSKSNIIVDPNDQNFVKGIIDFGDIVKTAIAIDLATAMLNQLPEKPQNDLFRENRDILTGYMSITELTEKEIALVPHLVMGRIIARALITIWRTKRFPDNAQYIMRNTEQGWHQLDWFLNRSIDEVSEIFKDFP